MTLQQGRSTTGSKHTPPEKTPRLRLKPKAPTSGYVDGAWWPHGDDLAIELPDLLAVLSVRLGPIDRVIYNVSEWAEGPGQTARRAAEWYDSAGTRDSRSTPSK